MRSVCRHYENRARFAPRPEVDAEGALPAAPGAHGFVVLLAQSCRAALRSLDGGPAGAPAQLRAASRVYLERLAAFRELITGINVSRFFASGDDPVVRVSRPVSATGEYLIARRFGLLSALDSWRRGVAGPQAGEAAALAR